MTTLNTNTLTAKAILLVRVSTSIQSLDEQTANLIVYAKSKGYLEENLIIIEDKESAIKLSEEERNGLNQMKEFIAGDSSIDAVFCWELSRLFRQQKTGYSLREYFITNHIQLFCYSPAFQLLTDNRQEVDGSGSIVFALFAEMADSEMRNKKARFKRTKIRNARDGKFSGGFRKFGYDVDKDGYYVINEVEADLVRLVFDLYESGLSIQKINKEIVSRGLTPYKFKTQSILYSEAYTGFSNEFGFDRNYPVIITAEQFDKCKAIAKTNNASADKAKETYYCSKLITCDCGYKYIGQVSTTSYMCYSNVQRENPEKKCSCNTPININVLDSLVWNQSKALEELNTINADKTTIENLKAVIAVNTQKIEAAKTNLKDLETKRDRNNDMYFDGGIKVEKYKANNIKIEEQEKDILTTISKFENENIVAVKKINKLTTAMDFISGLNNYSEYLNNLDSDVEKAAIIKKHVKEIKISNEVRNTTKLVTINYFNQQPERFRIWIKTKPVKIEKDQTFCYGGELQPVYVDYSLDIVRRFERKIKK